jgi:hypothetical protein
MFLFDCEMEYNPTFLKMPSTFFNRIQAQSLVLIGILIKNLNDPHFNFQLQIILK